MMWEGFRHNETGEIQVFPAGTAVTLPPPEWESITIPEGWPDGFEIVDGAIIPRRPRLDQYGIFKLFTPEEKAAILTSGIPEVMGLVTALLFMTEPMTPDDIMHQQGVALLLGLGLLTPLRAAQVLAFEAPQ